MNLAELKEQVALLSAKERFELAAFLAEIEVQDETIYHAEMSRRMIAMDVGQKVTQEEFETLHKKLGAQPR